MAGDEQKNNWCAVLSRTKQQGSLLFTRDGEERVTGLLSNRDWCKLRPASCTRPPTRRRGWRRIRWRRQCTLKAVTIANLVQHPINNVRSEHELRGRDAWKEKGGINN